MKAWRFWFLLVLAMLLPVRGAVAAAMLCPLSESGVQTEMTADHHPAGHEAMDHASAYEPSSGHAGGSTAGHDHTGSDKCTMCSAYCSTPPLAGDTPAFAAPLDPTAVKFCQFSAPAPSFLSDGQERPPRSI